MIRKKDNKERKTHIFFRIMFHKQKFSNNIQVFKKFFLTKWFGNKYM